MFQFLPRFGDSYTLIGSWIIDDEASEMGVSEDNTLITQRHFLFRSTLYCRLIILLWSSFGVNGAVMTILEFTTIETMSWQTHTVFTQPAPLNNSKLFLSDGALCEAVSREGAG